MSPRDSRDLSSSSLLIPTIAGAALAVALLGCAAREAATSGVPARRYADGALVSDSLPRFTFRADSSFHYAGAFPIRIDDIAGGERHVFVDTSSGRVRRMILLQFEGFLPNVRDEYRYAMRNPVTLAGQTYTHSRFAFSQAEAIREGPGREVDATLRYLTGKGLVVPDEQLTARYARILGDDRRNEVIIFYQEAAELHGVSMARAMSAEGFRPEYEWLADSLSAWSRRAFTIEEGTGSR